MRNNSMNDSKLPDLLQVEKLVLGTRDHPRLIFRTQTGKLPRILNSSALCPVPRSISIRLITVGIYYVLCTHFCPSPPGTYIPREQCADLFLLLPGAQRPPPPPGNTQQGEARSLGPVGRIKVFWFVGTVRANFE